MMTGTKIAELAQVRPSSSPVAAPTHRLLAVVAGGQELLLRPEFVRGVYQIPAQQLSAQMDHVGTPEGTIPLVSMANCMRQVFGFSGEDTASDRTVIVFRYRGESIALRVHSVSRPIEVEPRHLFQIPTIAHPIGAPSFLDSVALVEDKETQRHESIRLVVDPMVALGLRELTESLALQSRQILHPILREGRATTPTSVRSHTSDRGHTQMLAFSPNNPLPAEFFFRFCLPVSSIAEVLHSQSIKAFPSASTILSGYLMWRSQPVPVIDLAKAFGASTAHAKPVSHGRILIANLPGRRHVAVPTETDIQTMKTPQSCSVDYPAIAPFPHLGAFPDDSSLLVVPDLNRILNRP